MSERPQIRPNTTGNTEPAGQVALLRQAPTPALQTAPRQSQRPRPRPDAMRDAAAETTSSRQAPSDAALGAWVKEFRPRALSAGIRAATYDRAMSRARYDSDIIRRDRSQAEFSKAIWEYLDTAVSDLRVENGRKALAAHRDTLDRIEKTYGVEKEVVTAVWGLESAYGTFRGKTHIVSALATLAFDGRRASFFEEQLLAALRILDAGDTTPDNMTGSWAGAMGHTQFMPTSFLDYAVDFTGDGRRDIWSEDPTDALASTAAYLSRHGWTRGQPWGVEVVLPEGFDYHRARRDLRQSSAAWAAEGVLRPDGTPVPDHGRASILLPAGAHGVAFMIFDNFKVIESYNTADAYVIAVGHLSDRLRGRSGFESRWPRGDRALSFDERKELQRRLTRAGFDTEAIDGRVGPLTIEAVRRYQAATGEIPDGYASLRVLESLRN
ncbi:lytic murein transglycosylase [Aquicoccus sp. SCR17]|nr:lytic murein transglycosylase [Carideicomes alvinocaridis]